MRCKKFIREAPPQLDDPVKRADLDRREVEAQRRMVEQPVVDGLAQFLIGTVEHPVIRRHVQMRRDVLCGDKCHSALAPVLLPAIRDPPQGCATCVLLDQPLSERGALAVFRACHLCRACHRESLAFIRVDLESTIPLPESVEGHFSISSSAIFRMTLSAAASVTTSTGTK